MKENNMTLLKKETVHYKMEDVEFIPIWSRLLINYLREEYPDGGCPAEL